MDYSIKYIKFLKNDKISVIKKPTVNKLGTIQFTPYGDGIYGVYIGLPYRGVEINSWESGDGYSGITFELKEDLWCTVYVYDVDNFHWYGNIFKDYYVGIIISNKIEEKYVKEYDNQKLWKLNKMIKHKD